MRLGPRSSLSIQARHKLIYIHHCIYITSIELTYHAIHRRGKITSKDIVFLFGLGGLGFNVLQDLDDAMKIGVDPADIVPVGKSIREWKVAGLVKFQSSLIFSALRRPSAMLNI
jgi:hypothetical protein